MCENNAGSYWRIVINKLSRFTYVQLIFNISRIEPVSYTKFDNSQLASFHNLRYRDKRITRQLIDIKSISIVCRAISQQNCNLSITLPVRLANFGIHSLNLCSYYSNRLIYALRNNIICILTVY